MASLGYEDGEGVWCQVCIEDNRDVEAATYCLQCNQYLCPACVSIHGRLQTTKHHQLLSGLHLQRSTATRVPSTRPTVAGPPRTTSSLTSATEFCPLHTDQDLNYFCVDHDTCCCILCKLTFHEECSVVEELPVLAVGIRGSARYRRTEQDTGVLLSELQTLAAEMKAQIRDVETQKATVCQEIDEAAEKATNQVEVLFSKAKEEVLDVETRRKAIVTEQVTSLDRIRQDIQAQYDQIQRLIVGGSEKKLFLTLKSAARALGEYRRQVNTIQLHVRQGQPFEDPGTCTLRGVMAMKELLQDPLSLVGQVKAS